MREKIILAPGVNAHELVRSMASHGVNCFNIRVMGAVELARYALMRSGITIDQEYIDSKGAQAIMSEAVKGEPYFATANLSDIEQIESAIRRIRSLIPNQDETTIFEKIMSKGIFSEKNYALINIYKKYISACQNSNFIDSISLIRKAISESTYMESEFVILTECMISPIEMALLQAVSKGNYSSCSLIELFNIDNVDIHISSYKNCYGSPNEVNAILDAVYKSQTLDKCVVAVTNTTVYAQAFFDAALLYDIPITFGTGIPISNSNPAKLLEIYYHWMTDGFFGASALEKMINSDAFNKSLFFEGISTEDEDFSIDSLFERLFALKLTNDASRNAVLIDNYKLGIMNDADNIYTEALTTISQELTMPCEDFIHKYARLRTGNSSNADEMLMKLDRSARSAIYNELSAIRQSGFNQAEEDVIKNILSKTVCAGAAEAGSLHVTSIDKAMITLRENLYIAGLSASMFPGSPKENYLVLDEDLKLFNSGTEYLTSSGKIVRKRNLLMSLARLASGLGCNIFVSYAGLNVSELKQDNASSMIFELYRAEHGEKATSEELAKTIINVGYFEPAISVTREIGVSYNSGKEIKHDMLEKAKDEIGGVLLEKEYSPSALNVFFNCPRDFFISNILGISETEEDNPFEILSAAQLGTLAHSLMEQLANSNLSAEDFHQMASEWFDKTIKQNTPLIAENVKSLKEEFLEMIDIAYEMDPHLKVVLEEEDVHCTHKTGVKIHGLPDRVEQLEDGSVVIVDFKTGRKLSHEKDDIDSCLQIVIYAYLVEQAGYKVSHGVFRYIRLGEEVECKYDEEMKQALNEKLEFFKESMESGNFFIPDSDEEERCKYCGLATICGKLNQKLEVE